MSTKPPTYGPDSHSASVQEHREPSLARRIAFTAIIVVSVLWVANRGVEWSERRGYVDTQRPAETVQFLDEPAFELDGHTFRTSSYGEGTLVSSEFAANKADRFRVFVLGGSFAMGTPYVNGESPQHGMEGGIASWLQAHLSHRFPQSTLELVNAAAGGQNARRVREIALEVLELEPDLLLVATGNNEGNLDPSLVQAELRKLGGYRLLRKLLLGSASKSGSWFTQQNPDTSAIANQFRGHISAILDAAQARGVPVLLCTLPVHLSYLGFEPGHVITGTQWPPMGGPCEDGLRAFEAGDYAGSLGPLQLCIDGPAAHQPPPVRSYLALAKLELGQPDAGPLEILEEERGECIARGISSYYRGKYRAARKSLRRCDEIADALLWIGRANRKLGDPEAARNAMAQSVELVPRNRTRPSFNAILREEATERPGVFLVDLERAAEELSPDGIPGPSLFLDYSHMHWWGYAAMADVVLAKMREFGLEPAEPPTLAPPPDRRSLARAFRLPPLPASAHPLPPPATISATDLTP
ncbi:MAG TPA: hypothetical protein DIU15_19065 [Deltaproteobacteria bacterium]|nr:hypothetical protein [Deltaproteobacteria bacterium]HCP48147.1 hypothetical protein [Deltaproteobacteria bacterium]